MEYVPGPWRAQKTNAGWSIVADSVSGQIVTGRHWYGSHDTYEANMKLIATAPDMDRMLRQIHDELVATGTISNPAFLVKNINAMYKRRATRGSELRPDNGNVATLDEWLLTAHEFGPETSGR